MTFPRRAPLLAATWVAATWIAVSGAAVLSACSPPAPTPEQRASQAAVAACRQRADDVFARQNRAAIFNDRMDDPRSGGYVSGITTRGLSERFAWDNQVQDCVRNQGAATDTGPGFAPNPAPTNAAAPLR